MHPPRITRLPAPALSVLAGASVLATVLPIAGCARSAAAPGAPVPGPAIGRPPALSAHLVLPSRTMAAGSRMTGQVLMDNHSGHAVHTFGCLSLFQVALTSGSYRPTVAWPACLQRFTIPVGVTRYRVTVWASYSQCGQARPLNGLKACLPGGRMPPLPPGTYHARLYRARPLVRVPPAITVRVMPARPDLRLRPGAATSPDRLFAMSMGGEGPGTDDPGLAVLGDRRAGAWATSWTAVLDAVRLGPEDDETEVAGTVSLATGLGACLSYA